MAVLKSIPDLLTQASTTLPNNTTQAISPSRSREMAENNAFSAYNKITDASIVGLKEYDSAISYPNDQCVMYLGSLYQANTATTPGTFAPAEWDLLAGGDTNIFSTNSLTMPAARSHSLGNFQMEWDNGRFKLIGSDDLEATKLFMLENNSNAQILEVRNNGTLISSLFTSATSDGNLWNNSINFYTDGTSLKARYKDNGGTASDLTIGGADNFASADLTLTSSRTHDLDSFDLVFENGQTTIKGAGSTDATTSFLIQNLSSDDHFKVFGNGEIAIGRSTMAGGEYISIEANMFGTFRNLYFKNTNSGSNSAACWLMENGSSQRTCMGMGSPTSSTPELQDRAVLWGTSAPSATDGVAIIAESSSVADAANRDISFVVGPLANGAFSEAVRIDRDGDVNLNKSSILFSNEANSSLISSARITAELLSENVGDQDSELQFSSSKNGSLSKAMTIDEDQFIVAKANSTAIADSALENEEMTFYMNGNDLNFKWKDSLGVVRTLNIGTTT